MRNIDDILNFREDISPFLVHLTRNTDENTASEALKKIIAQKKLRAGSTEVSVARFGGPTTRMSLEEKKKFFNAVCFTETPLNEVHCLLEIAGRQVEVGILFAIGFAGVMGEQLIEGLELRAVDDDLAVMRIIDSGLQRVPLAWLRNLA